MAGSKEPTRRETRQRLAALLESDDFRPALQELRRYPRRRVLSALRASLCEPDEGRRARAVHAMGLLTAELAGDSMEEAREWMRRLMWSLNDESGSIGWGAPEAMAEIMTRHERLAEDYAPMLVSYMREDGNYLENPRLQSGLLRGIGRLAAARPGLMKRHRAGLYLLPYLQSDDRIVQGLAAWCAGVLVVEEARPLLDALTEAETEIVLYREGSPVRSTAGHLAREALGCIEKAAVSD